MQNDVVEIIFLGRKKDRREARTANRAIEAKRNQKVHWIRSSSPAIHHFRVGAQREENEISSESNISHQRFWGFRLSHFRSSSPQSSFHGYHAVSSISLFFFFSTLNSSDSPSNRSNLAWFCNRDECFEFSLEEYGIKDHKASGSIVHYLDDKGIYQVL